MLESLHRRPRGLTTARILQKAGLTAPAKPLTDGVAAHDAARVPIDVHQRAIGSPPSGPGAVTEALLSRLEPADREALEARLDTVTRPIWEKADESERAYLQLAFSLHHDVPGVAERTGLSAAEPPEGVHVMARGPVATGGAYYSADLVAEGLRAAGGDFSPGMRVLDFGCSSGRVVRVLAPYAPSVEWHGCDPIADAVDWASRNVADVSFQVSPEYPPLPYDDDSFDLVYAISIWSHFSEAAALRWFEEMRRIIAPGGHLLATTQAWHTTHHLAVNGLWDERDVSRTIAQLYHRGSSFTPVFGEGGDYGVANPDWGMGFLSPEWLLTNLCPRWHVVSFAPGRVEGNQDVIVLRRAE